MNSGKMGMKLFALILSFFACLALAQEIPADWAPRVAAGQMLFSVNEPTDQTLMATVGNGYIATAVATGTQYVSGVFNGLNTQAPSHRARIPATTAIQITNNGLTPIGSALDMEQAVYYRRSTIAGIFFEQRWYAHQTQRNLLVHELFVSNPTEDIATIGLSLNNGGASSDFNFTTTAEGWGTAMVGNIVTPEEPGGQVVQVAMVYTNVPNEVSVSAITNTTFYFITSVITNLDSDSPMDDAISIYKSAVAEETNLLSSHIEAWADIWTSGIEVGGDLSLAQAINSSLYYILSSVRPDWYYSLSPGGLASNGYNGHTFWDCETWMYPSLLLLYPDLAQSVLQYRFLRIPGAELKAESEGYSGTMFPWESAFTGQEVCPITAATGQLEQHISGDIAFAIRQYFLTTQNMTWLQDVAYPMISGIAQFWLSRVALSKTLNQYVIDGVIPPDEYAVNVNNSVYTNYVAKLSLEFATTAAQLLGVSPNPAWLQVANNMYIPFDNVTQIHPEYDGYAGQTIKQADVVLLYYPLMMPMPTQVHYNDLVYYEARTDPNGPAMTYGMHAVSWISLGNLANASALFNRSYANIKAPFNIWTETPQGGTTNFITGAGGFLQGVWAGYGGVRITEDGLLLNPQLPDNVNYFKLRQLQYLGSWLDVALDTKNLYITLQDQEAGAPTLTVYDWQNNTQTLTVGSELVLTPGAYRITQ